MRAPRWNRCTPLLLTSLSFLLGMLPVSSNAQADQSDEIGILVTWGTVRAWEPLNPPKGLDAASKLTDKLNELKEQYPEDLLLDLGAYSGPGTTIETAFNAPQSVFFDEMEYDAVNLTSKDYMFKAADMRGFRQRPEKMKNLFLSSINYKDASLFEDFPTHTVVESSGGEVALGSVASIQKVSSMPHVVQHAEETAGADVIKSMTENFSGLSILMSDLSDRETEELAQSNPDLDLVLSTEPGEAKPRKAGNAFILPRQEPHEIQHVTMKLDDDGQIADVTAERIPWITPEEYNSLVKYPLPIIGMSVPGEGRVAERLNIEKDNVFLDVHRGSDFPNLTTRKDIYVYNITLDGERYRVYRVNHIVGRRYLPLDALVILNRDHTIRQVVTNIMTYPIAGKQSRMKEVMQAITNQPPNKWDVPSELIRGIEEHVPNVLDALKKTIELDKTLYGASE